MNVVQTQASIVVPANSHNPTIATKEWLARKKILTEPSVDYAHTPMMSLVETGTFVLYVDPQRLRVDVKVLNHDSLRRLPNVIKKYVETLPEVPYSAIGFNSRWHAHDVHSADILKLRFTGNSELFTKAFGSQHNVGGIVLWQYDAFRVQLTAHPAVANPVIDFNYHSDVEQADNLYERLARFVEINEHAHTTANNLLGGETTGHESASK